MLILNVRVVGADSIGADMCWCQWIYGSAKHWCLELGHLV